MNEQELIGRLQQGDQQALKGIIQLYQDYVYTIALQMVKKLEMAEEVTQDVFIKVYQKIEQFREEAKIQTWIYRIASNAFIDKKRRKVFIINESRRPEIESEMEIAEIQSQENDRSPERQTESSLIQKHIDKAMQKLSEKEKTAFIRFYNLETRIAFKFLAGS